MDEVVELNGTMKETEEEQHKKKKNDDDEGDNDRSTEEVVQWEKFLPRMVLRVLLVESDHSTRQIITALLKKCGYRVIAVPDGLKAWEMLKRKAPDLDLILTEVELPAISGFALLSLIMEHDICKNIPVIMMSSHDSVNMVLKCMLKGAVDFLIKPVRRNELRNLWQHVWRRHAITRPPQNNDKKLETAIEDNSASHQSSGSVASPQKNNEGSEKYSEAQSTCTSPFLEAESAHMESMQNASQLESSSKLSNIDTVKHEEFTKFKRESTKHNYETGEKSITCASEAARCDKTVKLTGLRLEQGHGSAEIENKDDNFRAELSTGNPNINTEIHGCSHELEQPSTGAIKLISTYENLPKHSNENCCLDGGNITKFDFDRQLDLSSRKDFAASSYNQASEAAEEWQRLNHSNTSAFSWYNGSKLWQPHFSTTQNASSKVNNDNWDSHESHKLSGIIAGNNLSNQNQENMTTTNVFTLFHAQAVVHPIWNPKPVCQNESSPFPSSTSSHSNPESHNSDQHNHWSDDANYTCLNQNVNDKINLDHARHDCPVAGKGANDLCHDVTNQINSSAYGSTDSGKDGNATSTMIAKNTPESFSDSGYHNYDGFRLMDSHRSSQREAALTKFRLKRKDRCYEKKVRYQSRKRLAEQRPRVKGQFVRQVQTVLSHEDANHPVTDTGGDS